MAEIARICVATLPVLLLVRCYEVGLWLATRSLPDGAGGLIARALILDVRAWLVIAAVAGGVAVLVALRWSRAAAIGLRVAIVFWVALGVVLSQYFVSTGVPLGADLFGYSASEIRETVAASRGVKVGDVAALLVAMVVAWMATGPRVTNRIPMRRAAVPALAVACIVGFVARVAYPQRVGAYESELAFSFAQNKTDHFVGQAIGHFAGGGAEGPAFAGYPLWRRSDAPDVLAPLLNVARRPPSIVLVIVEGLGREFVGPGAAYTHVTPFLDSLARSSLFWEHFVANQGRTFGVLPSLLGSLPPVVGGFTQLGASGAFPSHETLVSILGERGYATSYFTGTDGHFDLIDAFMEAQRVGRFVDQSSFPASYEKAPAGAGGFSWGYGDADLFRYAIAATGASQVPRLDVFLTITLHEPFTPPREAEYRERLERRLGPITIDPERADAYRDHADVFATLMYVDDAVRALFADLARRPDWENTIVVVTGDHRLIPVPEDTRLSRFLVPLIIASPLVKAPRRFPAISSHLDVAPSLLAHLAATYGVAVPDSVHWLGRGLDTASVFRNTQTIPLARTKTQLDNVLSGRWFLDGDELYEVLADMTLRRASDAAARDDMRRRLDSVRSLSRYVVAQNRLRPSDSLALAARVLEDSVWAANGLDRMNSDAQFEFIRQRAFAHDYATARPAARRMLRMHPVYHDVRTLLGRTYAWERRFDEARPLLEDVVRRAPEYEDARLALVDVDIWSGRGQSALARIDSGLKRAPRDTAYLNRRPRALGLIQAGGAR